jgi:hypothetical protein
MSLTPKTTGGLGPEHPYAVAYSALIENGFTSSPALGDDAHISLWFKHKPNHSSHHHVDIIKDGATVSVAIDGGVATPYTGTVGVCFHELIEGVLTEYAGSAVGFYSDLRAIDGADSTRLWTASAWTPGTIIPRNPSGVDYGTNGAWLDFGNALDLGADVSGNGNEWVMDATITWSEPATTGTAYANRWLNATYGPEKAFDGINSASSFWAATAPAVPNADFIALQPATPVRADRVTVHHVYSESSYWLQGYTIYGSLDSTNGVDGTWFELGSFPSPYPSAPASLSTALVGAVRGMMYKLVCTDKVTGHAIGFMEIEFQEAIQSEQSIDTPTNNLT